MKETYSGKSAGSAFISDLPTMKANEELVGITIQDTQSMHVHQLLIKRYEILNGLANLVLHP